jgi:3-oxoacyl-[acyl-carrier protein] reductase
VSKPTCLIIGASSDIGRELTRLLGPEYRIVAHCFRNPEVLSDLQHQGDLSILAADLTSEAGVSGLIAGIQTTSVCPDAIVFLAAPPLRISKFGDMTRALLHDHLEMHLHSPIAILQKYLPLMARRRSGKVVFVLSSVTFGTPPSGCPDYVMAKYAQLGLMKALSTEYASRNIQVNAVSPGLVQTKYLASLPSFVIEENAQRSPLKRNAVPADIAPLIAFLLSEGSNYMTGLNIPVTGGPIS